MKHTIKAKIKTPPKWIGWRHSECTAYIAAELRRLAVITEMERDDRRTIISRNGNTIAIEVKA